MRLFFGLIILLICIISHASINIIDDVGCSVYLDKPATRIVSLTPHITEILFSIGAGDLIVGTVKQSNYPKEVINIPKIGSYTSFDIERILELHPDLVIASKDNPRSLVDTLSRFNIPVYIVDIRHLEEISKSMKKISRLVNNNKQSVSSVSFLSKKIDLLRGRYMKKKKVKVFFQIWEGPLVTTNGKSVINDVIELCGGENIFKDLLVNYPTINEEDVLNKNPEIIITSRPNSLKHWNKWPKLRAVRNHHVYFLSPDEIQRYSPRILQGAKKICRFLEKSRLS